MRIVTLDTQRLCQTGGVNPASQGVAITIGNFDGVHRGHQMLLQRVRARARRAGLSSALLTFEPHPREFFDPDGAPLRLTSLERKTELLEQAGLELLVVARFDECMAGLSPQAFVRDLLVGAVGTRHLVIGDDFCFGRSRSGDIHTLRQAAREQGFGVEALGTLRAGSNRVSSTLIRECIGAGDFAGARQLLGRCHAVEGRVLKSSGTGEASQLMVALTHADLPRHGRYAVQLQVLESGVSLAGVGWRVDDAPGVGPGNARMAVACQVDGAMLEGRRVRLSFVGAERQSAQPFAGYPASRVERS